MLALERKKRGKVCVCVRACTCACVCVRVGTRACVCVYVWTLVYFSPLHTKTEEIRNAIIVLVRVHVHDVGTYLVCLINLLNETVFLSSYLFRFLIIPLLF